MDGSIPADNESYQDMDGTEHSKHFRHYQDIKSPNQENHANIVMILKAIGPHAPRLQKAHE